MVCACVSVCLVWDSGVEGLSVLDQVGGRPYLIGFCEDRDPSGVGRGVAMQEKAHVRGRRIRPHTG